MKIVLVEDHVMMRDIIRKVCAERDGFEVVAEAGTGADAVEAILRTAPDLVVLDLYLPDFDGLDVLARVRDTGHRPRVLVVSGFANPYLVFRLEGAQVDGFVDKRVQALPELREALGAVSSGRTYFSDTYLRLRDDRRQNPLAFDKLLNGLELEFLAYAAHGFDDAGIARHLDITRRAAEDHRREIMGILGLLTATDLMRYARENGFTFGPPPSFAASRLRVTAL